MKYEEAEKRLRNISDGAKLSLNMHVGTRDAEALDTILADVATWRSTCADAAGTLIVVSAQRDAYKNTLVKIKKLANRDDVPVAVLTEIINLVSNLNLGDAAEPQKDPS